MKGVFGILLVGGGIILMVGLFRGTIPFPLNFPQAASSAQTTTTTTGTGAANTSQGLSAAPGFGSPNASMGNH